MFVGIQVLRCFLQKIIINTVYVPVSLGIQKMLLGPTMKHSVDHLKRTLSVFTL